MVIRGAYIGGERAARCKVILFLLRDFLAIVYCKDVGVVGDNSLAASCRQECGTVLKDLRASTPSRGDMYTFYYALKGRDGDGRLHRVCNDSGIAFYVVRPSDRVRRLSSRGGKAREFVGDLRLRLAFARGVSDESRSLVVVVRETAVGKNALFVWRGLSGLAWPTAFTRQDSVGE